MDAEVITIFPIGASPISPPVVVDDDDKDEDPDPEDHGEKLKRKRKKRPLGNSNLSGEGSAKKRSTTLPAPTALFLVLGIGGSSIWLASLAPGAPGIALLLALGTAARASPAAADCPAR